MQIAFNTLTVFVGIALIDITLVQTANAFPLIHFVVIITVHRVFALHAILDMLLILGDVLLEFLKISTVGIEIQQEDAHNVLKDSTTAETIQNASKLIPSAKPTTPQTGYA